MIVIKNWSIKPYCIDFINPLNIKKDIIYKKTGSIINVYDNNNYQYTGELSILENIHSCSLEQANIQLNNVLNYIKGIPLNLSKTEFTRPFLGLISDILDTYPPVLFSIESILLQIINRYNKKYLYKQIPKTWSVKVNTLLIPNKEHKPSELIKTFKRENIDTVKIKVTKENKNWEIDFLNQIFKKAPNNIKFRLDGNGNLDIKTINNWINNIEKFADKVEYIEEPFSKISEYRKLKKLPIKIGIDENLQYFFKKNKYPDTVNSLVIKPTLYAISGSMNIAINSPSNFNKIISSTFESIVGMRILGIISYFIASKACGLDTGKYLISPSLPTINGNIKFERF